MKPIEKSIKTSFLGTVSPKAVQHSFRNLGLSAAEIVTLRLVTYAYIITS